MRYFLLLIAGWLLALAVQAAPLPPDTAALQVNRLPATGGLLLKNGWRYHAGDNPAWARPDCDDRGWETLNPTRPRRELPRALGTGISWLRLRFRLSDSLRARELALHAFELGAVELYLNGRLVQRQGVLHADPARVQPRGRFPGAGLVPAAGPAEQVLAVRYAPWQPPLLRGLDRAPMLAVQLYLPEAYGQGGEQQRNQANVFLVTLGFSALLTLLHLAFFRYNPARRANRYFARYAFVATLASGAAYWTFAGSFATLVPYLVMEMVANALAGMIGLWTVRALYDLFHVPPGRIYAGLWVAYGGLMLLIVVFQFHPVVFVSFALLLVLPIVEQLRLTQRAVRRRQRGAGLVAGGFVAGLLAALAYVGVVLLFPERPQVLVLLLMAMVFLLPALGISLFLAREFALDAQLLQVQLGEVERLSAQTLAQEQEKQALLAVQNNTLEQQVQQRTSELQRSLTDLRTTQAQLIQKEKMASLGELTAGIAHEIQNPLNFVNNFSEVSAELVEELEEEQQRPSRDAALEAELLGDLKENLHKISQHGRRAAGIVKGMLEHSSSSAGEREPTDLNRLCDEYLRLAYQGLRAKDKTFNAALNTNFLADLPPVTLVGADVGRVLLNLFTNAFYAVRQRQQQGEPGYQPQVGVRTLVLNQQVQIQVTDNGTGMSTAVQGKIFQPFFTTKPTGEGTGLGLSLSHDIIAQGHGGALTVESQEGQGTAFIICLPI